MGGRGALAESGRGEAQGGAGGAAFDAQSLVLAQELLRAGRLEAAEELYRALLAAAPRDPLCLHHLGLIAHRRGAHEEAAELVAEAVAARHPEIEFTHAHYLDDHPLVVETFVERIRGIEAGDVSMNCSLCKYRTQIIGFEGDLGAPQESHHHHVEGIGTDGGHHHDHHHHHHTHDHQHPHPQRHGNGVVKP